VVIMSILFFHHGGTEIPEFESLFLCFSVVNNEHSVFPPRKHGDTGV
jgi:hypothetical protein